MKRFLATLSAILITASSSSSVISCSTKNAENVKIGDVTPKYGWPHPLNDKSFLPVWENFYSQVKQEITNNVAEIINDYSNSYINLYLKFKKIENKNKQSANGLDGNGVPNDEVTKMWEAEAVSQAMYDYQKNSLRLFYIEMKISYFKTGQKHLSDDELSMLWAMKYFKSYPFFQWAKIAIPGTTPTQIYEAAINYDFYTFPKAPTDVDGNPLWSELPKEEDRTFKGYLKMPKKYSKVADSLYDEILRKDGKND